eukprot:jgi/Chlat1/4192/Chrsp27S08878
MKLVHRNIGKDGAGSIKMIPEQDEDLWHAYNLISEGDRVLATTFRKVQKETAGGGAGDSERVRLKLCITVESVEYDAAGAVLRLHGKNVSESEHVKFGAYHTIELDLQRAFTLSKDNWDSVALRTVKTACDPAATADVAAVLMAEGLAHVCLVGPACTVDRARIETSLPRKRGAAAAGHEKARTKFFEQVLQAIVRHVTFETVKCLVIASPGFTKDAFYQYMMMEAQRQDIRSILENKGRIILAHSSSGYKHALKEVLADPHVAGQMKDTKAAKEVAALNDFYTMMGNDATRAFYGPGHVEAAHERLAIQTLLISDSLFRNANVPTRKRYVQLVEEVKQNGGEVFIFSTMHPSGQQLDNLTGVAAILRFPMPDLADEEL